MSTDEGSPIESLVENALERITFKSNVHSNSHVTSSGDFLWKKRSALTSDAVSFNSYRQKDSALSVKGAATSVQQSVDIHVLSAPDGEEGGIFATIDVAVAAAKKAQQEMKEIPLHMSKKIIAAMREAVLKNAEVLSVMAVKETKMGR